MPSSGRAWLIAAFVSGCGARTELEAPNVAPPDASYDAMQLDAGPTSCTVTGPLATGTLANADLHLTGDAVYWNDGTSIRRVSKGGGAVTTVVIASVDLGAYDVGADVYYAPHGSSSVQRATGSVLGTFPGPVVRVAGSGDALYVVAPHGDFEALYELPARGGAPTLVAPLQVATIPPLGGEPEQITGLVVRDGVAYLAMIAGPPKPYVIAAVDLASGGVTLLSATPLSLPPTSVATDGAYVYYADYVDQEAPSFFRVSTGGGTPQPVGETQTYCTSCMFPAPVAVGGGSMFFPSDENDSTLQATAVTGGTPSVVATAAVEGASIDSLASDGACVYWTALRDPVIHAAPIGH